MSSRVRTDMSGGACADGTCCGDLGSATSTTGAGLTTVTVTMRGALAWAPMAAPQVSCKAKAAKTFIDRSRMEVPAFKHVAYQFDDINGLNDLHASRGGWRKRLRH